MITFILKQKRCDVLNLLASRVHPLSKTRHRIAFPSNQALYAPPNSHRVSFRFQLTSRAINGAFYTNNGSRYLQRATRSGSYYFPHSGGGYIRPEEESIGRLESLIWLIREKQTEIKFGRSHQNGINGIVFVGASFFEAVTRHNLYKGDNIKNGAVKISSSKMFFKAGPILPQVIS